MLKLSLTLTAAIFAMAVTTISMGEPANAEARLSPIPSWNPAKGIKWGKTPFGPMAATVSGDFSKGGHITYIKFTGGMKTPIHTHTADYVGMVVSGTTRHFLPGKPETKTLLGAGSFWSMPADVPHVSECMPGAECIMAVYQKSAFDFHPKK